MGLDNPLHIAILVVILLLIFGAKRIPEIARSLGTGLTEFRDAVSGRDSRSLSTPPQEQPAPAQPTVDSSAPPQPAQPTPQPVEASATVPPQSEQQ